MPTPTQLTEQAVRHQVHLERLKSGASKDMLKLLRDMEHNILGTLAGENITEWTRTRMERQLSAVREIMLLDLRGPMLSDWRGRVVELAEYETGFEVRSLGNVVKADFTLPTSEALQAAVFTSPLTIGGADNGKLLEPFFRDWTDAQVDRVTGAVRAGFAQGQTTQQILSGLRQELFPINRRGMEAAVKTSLQHASSQARQATWGANVDIIKGVRWVSTLDGRTSDQCRSLDGQVFPLDKGPRPPAHVNCRSTTVGVLADDVAIFDKDGTRVARDPATGKIETVSAQTTYYGWLKRQPAKFQDSVIGPTRGKLLRNGGLSSDRFAELQLGKRFEPLTLDQMRKMEPVAFEKANIN